jgi:hypothetical protein
MIATTTRATSRTRIIALAAIAGLAALALSTAGASAYSDRVLNACEGDYLSYCSSYDVESPKLRGCMRAAANNLSQVCVNALIAAGEVSKSEAARHSENDR